jgi:hypothetical protein
VEIVRKRSILQLRTPFGEVPKEWLDIIEPKIVRPDDTTCWLWNGSTDERGEPRYSIQNQYGHWTTRTCKSLIAGIFWILPQVCSVFRSCKSVNCLNPNHFIVTTRHYTQVRRGYARRSPHGRPGGRYYED